MSVHGNSDWLSCRHPFGCQASGEGCVGQCPVTEVEGRAIEAAAFGPRVEPAPELSDAEFSRLRAIELAPDAPESIVERVAWAIAMSDAQGDEERARGYYKDFPGLYGKRADAAIAVLRGEPYPPQR